MWADQWLEVDRCSSVDGLESQHHRLELGCGLQQEARGGLDAFPLKKQLRW